MARGTEGSIVAKGTATGTFPPFVARGAAPKSAEPSHQPVKPSQMEIEIIISEIIHAGSENTGEASVTPDSFQRASASPVESPPGCGVVAGHVYLSPSWSKGSPIFPDGRKEGSSIQPDGTDGGPHAPTDGTTNPGNDGRRRVQLVGATIDFIQFTEVLLRLEPSLRVMYEQYGHLRYMFGLLDTSKVRVWV